MRTSRVILGVLAGVAAGAIIGVLMAPDSGENTRKKISSKSQDVMDDLKSRFNTLVDSFASLKEEVRDNIAMAKNKAADTVNKATDTVRKMSAQ
jgi:gas vesicle protein